MSAAQPGVATLPMHRALFARLWKEMHGALSGRLLKGLEKGPLRWHEAVAT